MAKKTDKTTKPALSTVKVLMVAEVKVRQPMRDHVTAALDRFREATAPDAHGITLYQATRADCAEFDCAPYPTTDAAQAEFVPIVGGEPGTAPRTTTHDALVRAVALLMVEIGATKPGRSARPSSAEAAGWLALAKAGIWAPSIVLGIGAPDAPEKGA